MVYVISDIHGNIEAFNKMLKEINFNENDKLYVIGDMIDRNPGGLSVMRKVYGTPNMFALLGNHELMMIDHFDGKRKALWDMNGGYVTLVEFESYYATGREVLLSWLKRLPSLLEISVGKRKFVLCHSNPMAKEDFNRVWDRVEKTDDIGLDPNKTYIVGHTPTFFICGRSRICKNDFGDMYYIDCGAAYKGESNKLACLRLDDMKAFYVDA